MRKGIFKYPDNRFGGHLPKRIPEPSETRLSDNSVTHGFNDFMTQCRHSSLVRRTASPQNRIRGDPPVCLFTETDNAVIQFACKQKTKSSTIKLNRTMSKEIFVAFATQKGGIGKSTVTALAASYLHNVKGYNVAVVDCDDPQHSIHGLREHEMGLLAIGVTPDTHLAKEAGLELGIRGSIAVNERMETSVPDIYAVGDAVEVTHFVTGQRALISLAGPANKQGRIAADNICGGNSRFHGSQGSSVLKLFGLTAASTGINEKAAQAAEIAYNKVVLFPASHAAYYPGAQSMAMKILYEKESLRLLGAQIVGGEGVDKRIDVLATAIRAKMTALELTELDLSYAPPYSSAKDPVNMAGFMIEDLESGKVQQFHWNDIEDLPCDGSATLLDVRTEGEYRRGRSEEHTSELQSPR